MSEIIDKEREIRSNLHLHNNQKIIAYCSLSNRFVLKMYISNTDEILCLHSDTTEQEKDEISLYIEKEANYVYIEQDNGRIQNMSISEFDKNLEEGYLEHKMKNIAINLQKSSTFSYTYTYDDWGEIADRTPLRNVIIY